jgi:type III secretion protein S
MDHQQLIELLQATLRTVLAMSLPVLLGAMGVGLVVGLLQAVTQIQDQSLPIVFKLLVVIGILVLLGPTLVAPLVQLSERMLDSLPVLIR